MACHWVLRPQDFAPHGAGPKRTNGGQYFQNGGRGGGFGGGFGGGGGGGGGYGGRGGTVLPLRVFL